MAREKGQLYVGVKCDNCGVHGEGIPSDGDRARCGKCGQFGKKAESYCAEHDVNYASISGHDACPMCKEERRINEREREMMQRRSDPNMHNMVDAQANAIDHY